MTQSDQLASILEDCRYALMDCDRDCDYALIERIDAYRAQADKQGEAVACLFDGTAYMRSEVDDEVWNASEKLYASPPQVAPPLADEQIEALAHRIAWRYKKSSDPHHSDTYTFNKDTLIQFAAAIGKVEA